MHERDRAIVLAVGRFGQLASAHVQSLFFTDNASQTPHRRSLARLTESKYLARIERRMAGGSGAGSGQYVYQLGPKGWDLCRRDGRYFPHRAVNHHSLAVADAFVSLHMAEQAGKLTIERYDVEDDAHRIIAHTRLTPDLFVRVRPIGGKPLSLWVEVDLGTERQRQIADKLARYYNAYTHATTDDIPAFPRVLFLVPDAFRQEQIADWVGRQPEESQRLFRVVEQRLFPRVLL